MATHIIEDTVLDANGSSSEDEAENENEKSDDPGIEFVDSENEVNDGNFEYDDNVPERVVVGLNSDITVEERREDANEPLLDSDSSYDPSSEELHTDYSSGEEGNITYPAFNEEKELWDPKFDVGKTFRDMEQFRRAVKNHGVATRCNLKMKTNDDKRAQAVCKNECSWRI